MEGWRLGRGFFVSGEANVLKFIAEMKLRAIGPKGRPFPVRIRIGRPSTARTGRALHYPSACRIEVSKLQAPTRVYGEDSIQALSLAMVHIQSVLARFVAGGGELFFEDGKSRFDPAAYFPWMKR